jgi:hypothetical protein
MKFDVSQDNFFLLDTFSLVLIKGKAVRIQIDEETILIFELQDSNDKKSSISTKLVDKTTLKLNLINFNNPQGTCTVEPMLIGDYQGKKLYVHFATYAIGNRELDRSKILICSLFQEK